MVSLEDVYKLFVDALSADSWPPVTDQIMKALHSVGRSIVADAVPGTVSDDACLAYYKGCSEGTGEFMQVDLCCMAANSNNMLVAAESEIRERTAAKIVDDDFQKLVYLKAPYKVLVFKSF